MTHRFKGWLIALIVAMFLGPLLRYAFQSSIMWITDEMGVRASTVAMWNIWMGIVAVLPISIICVLWVGSVCRREERNLLLWCIFAALFQIVGVAVFFALLAYEKANQSPQTRATSGPRMHPIKR